MDWSLWALLGFLAFGIVVGAYGTLIGAGGGFIVVPVLLLFFGWPHAQASATSLLVVTANAASGSLSYWRQKRIDVRTGWQFALATLPGAWVGSNIAHLLNGPTFNRIFGSILVIVSVYLMFRPVRTRAGGAVRPKPPGPAGWMWTVRHMVDNRGEVYDWSFSKFWGLALSFVVGFLSSILGIGGGIIHVPALINLFDFPAHVATATSHFVLVWSAATGTISYITHGDVQFGPGIAMALGALGGAQVGGAVSHRVKGTWIVRGLAGALTLVGIRLLIG